MPLDFPDAPVINDKFEAAGKAYVFDGVAWAYDVAPVSGARPTLTVLDPWVVGVADPDLAISLQGTGFVSTSVVFIGVTAVPATFVSSTELSVPFSPATEGIGAYTFSVNNDGLTSEAKRFDVIPYPTVTSANPTTSVAGSAKFFLSLGGTGFSDAPNYASVVYLDDIAQPTEYNGPTFIQIDFTPPAAAATIMVTVKNGPVEASTAPLTHTVTATARASSPPKPARAPRRRT